MFLPSSASMQGSHELSTNNLDGVNDIPGSYLDRFDSCWHFTERFAFFASDFLGPDSHAFPLLPSHLLIVGDESLSLIVRNKTLTLTLTLGIVPLPHLKGIGEAPWARLWIHKINDDPY